MNTHDMPAHEIEHLLDAGKLTVTFMVDDFFITAEFFKEYSHFCMVVHGISGGVIRIEKRDTLVSLLLALVFDEVTFTPNAVESEKVEYGNTVY